MNKEITKLEEAILEALLQDIDGCKDEPLDMFKALERYKLFNDGRMARAEADHADAYAKKRLNSDEP